MQRCSGVVLVCLRSPSLAYKYRVNTPLILTLITNSFFQFNFQTIFQAFPSPSQHEGLRYHLYHARCHAFGGCSFASVVHPRMCE